MIYEKIGKGGCGEVFNGKDINNGERVAIKVIPKSGITNKDRLERLMNEVNIMREMNCNRVVRFIDFFEDSTNYYLIMELISGITLYTLLCRAGKLRESAVTKIIYQVGQGIMHLHKRGIAHRDIKPENIIIDQKMKKIKIIDLGFASKLKECSDFCGSLSYMAPEILLGNKYDPFKADIWSLGVLYYTLLEARLPWKFDSRKAHLAAILNNEIILPMNLTEHSRKILAGSFAVDPVRRFNIEQFMKATGIQKQLLTQKASSTFRPFSSNRASISGIVLSMIVH